MPYGSSIPTCKPKFRFGDHVLFSMECEDDYLWTFTGTIIGICWQPEMCSGDEWSYWVHKDWTSNCNAQEKRDWALESELVKVTPIVTALHPESDWWKSVA